MHNHSIQKYNGMTQQFLWRMNYPYQNISPAEKFAMTSDSTTYIYMYLGIADTGQFCRMENRERELLILRLIEYQNWML